MSGMPRCRTQQWIVYTLITGVLFPLAAFSQSAPQKPRTVWDGVYNEAQQQRGYSAYTLYCSRCHGEDLSGARGVLRGTRFMDRWREDSLNSLFTIIKDTMPPGPRQGISAAEYVDIVAYLLSANQFPAGTRELASDELDRIQVLGKEGPKPVPDFALVTVVGCLAAPVNGRWVLTNASEPVRTRNPRESAAAELAAAAARPGGSHTFGLLDTINFPRELRAGRWMEAKGLLIRSPGDDRLNLTWLHTLRETCESSSSR
jgi:S-disulfanyl-L-cysteine oxidoreductase SoxD